MIIALTLKCWDIEFKGYNFHLIGEMVYEFKNAL